METGKYVVILSSKNGGKNHLKMDVDQGRKRVCFTLGKGVKSDDAFIVLFGDEIAKQTLYKDKNEYKMRFQAKKQIDVILFDEDETYVGSTGKTPSFDVLNNRLMGFENGQNKGAKSEENIEENLAKKDEEREGENCFEMGMAKPVDFDGVGTEIDTSKSDDKTEEFRSVASTLNSVDDDAHSGRDGLNLTSEKCECVTSEKGDKATSIEGADAIKSDSATSQKSRDASGFSFDEVHFDGSNFYLSVKPQIDEIFVCYPELEELNNAVPNSRWVQVEAVDGFYVVGLVYDLDAVSYICYGVPSKEGKTPPDEIKNFCVWLPISCEKGYWVIYQDALTGKCLK